MNRVLSASLILSILSFSSCIGVTRLPERNRTPLGTVNKIDLGFLQSGKTTRAEVVEKLKPIDTGLHSGHFFLGHWDSSKWGGWVVIAGDNSSYGGGGRFWHNINLLAEFDDQGILKRYETFPDKQLNEKLAPVVAESEPLSGTECVEMAIQFGDKNGAPGTLILTAGSMEFIEENKVKKSMHFTVPHAQATGIGFSVLADQPDPSYVGQVLHFSSNLKQLGGPNRNRLYLRVAVPDLVILSAYIAHTGPGNKPPEAIATQ